MAQNVSIAGASYANVPAIEIPNTLGGIAKFVDTSDANASATDIQNGKTAYVNGVKITGTGSGGDTNVKRGTLTIASDVKTSTSTKITDVASIGFTPKAFLIMRSDASTTRYHMLWTLFLNMGTTYFRSLIYRSTAGNTHASANNNWTTQTAGYLYFNSNTVYYRSSSSYYLGAGTYYWMAMTW